MLQQPIDKDEFIDAGMRLYEVSANYFPNSFIHLVTAHSREKLDTQVRKEELEGGHRPREVHLRAKDKLFVDLAQSQNAARELQKTD